MRLYRARFRGQGVFFAFQSWAGCITNIFGFDLRQAQPSVGILFEPKSRSFIRTHVIGMFHVSAGAVEVYAA